MIIPLRIKTVDPETVSRFQKDRLLKISEKATLEIKSIEPLKGAVFGEFIVDMLLNLEIGVASGLLASWIYENLSGNGKNSINVNDRPGFTREELKEIISECIKEYHEADDSLGKKMRRTDVIFLDQLIKNR